MSTARQPDVTRQRLLECAFDEIHKRGFRSASLDAILDKAGVTKGALYHHFDNKNALGYAVLDELVRPYMQAQWEPLRTADDPVSAAVAGLRKRREKLREMSPAERRALLRERRETLERMTPAERRALREKLRSE